MIKKALFNAANLVGADSLFRRINKKKLLVIMYHGVTANNYDPPVWTQLPVATFRDQLEFLLTEYVFVSLGDVVAAIRNDAQLPERAVLITFDDGLKNNFTAAFPVLVELALSAAIFLTVDYVESDEILWVDELFFLLLSAVRNKISVNLHDAVAGEYMKSGKPEEAYAIMVEKLKRSGVETRTKIMEHLRELVPLDLKALREDFGMLGWSDIHTMQQSGLVEFGVHTATHRILAELTEDEWKKELFRPKQTLENKLNREIATFCYPNGRPGIDYRQEHVEYLRKVGYACAFITGRPLFDFLTEDSMEIGRVAGGNDATSEKSYFRLNASGALKSIKNRFKKAIETQRTQSKALEL